MTQNEFIYEMTQNKYLKEYLLGESQLKYLSEYEKNKIKNLKEICDLCGQKRKPVYTMTGTFCRECSIKMFQAMITHKVMNS